MNSKKFEGDSTDGCLQGGDTVRQVGCKWLQVLGRVRSLGCSYMFLHLHFSSEDEVDPRGR